MRPLAGVVVEANKKSTLVELETGVLFSTNNQYKLKVGHKVWVTYDFTKMEVKHIFKDDPNRQLNQDTTEQVVVSEEGKDGDEEPEENSGALSPEFDGVWEFWDSDNGILELPE